MARNITQEERQLIKLVEQMPLPEGDKNNWLERIRNGEMSKELADEIRQRLVEAGGEENEAQQANRTRYLSEFTVLVKRWQFASQARNFSRR
ncbi:MAG: hypothetical protein GX491_12660 [Chloroflexi bacterium]|nr:hypothetical protein [Chloroflexota bacterium]